MPDSVCDGCCETGFPVEMEYPQIIRCLVRSLLASLGSGLFVPVSGLAVIDRPAVTLFEQDTELVLRRGKSLLSSLEPDPALLERLSSTLPCLYMYAISCCANANPWSAALWHQNRALLGHGQPTVAAVVRLAEFELRLAMPIRGGLFEPTARFHIGDWQPALACLMH